MDRTGARQSRPHHYAGRPPRADGSLHAFNLTAARLAPRAGVSSARCSSAPVAHDLELFSRAFQPALSILAQPAFRRPSTWVATASAFALLRTRPRTL